MANFYIHRAITVRLKKMIQHFPSVVVVGARQVGKSTLVKHLFPHFSYVLFDPYEDVENARRDPDFFLSNHKLPIILDEVQYAPEVISAVKRRIDRDRTSGQYILTGSQQWGVMKRMAESLTGRTVILQLESFSLSEIAANPPDESWLLQWLSIACEPTNRPAVSSYLQLPCPTYEQLWRGFLPEAQKLPLELVASFHETYQKTYIERDLRLLTDVSNLHLFMRFVRLVAALTAQEINYQEIGRDLGVANETAKRWLNSLKEIFEWHEIPAFSMNTLKRISKKPKGYFADTGQICFSQAISSPQAIGGHPLWGSLFETAVVNEIRKQLLWTGNSGNLYHWRSHGGAECDLIIEQDGFYYPIEIKSKTHPTRSDATGLQAFRKTYPSLKIAKGLVLCHSDKLYPLTEQDKPSLGRLDP